MSILVRIYKFSDDADTIVIKKYGQADSCFHVAEKNE